MAPFRPGFAQRLALPVSAALRLLRMADEQSRLRGTPSAIPKGKDRPSLLAKDGDELEVHYRHTLEELGKCSGMLGIIFRSGNPKEAAWHEALVLRPVRRPRNVDND